ncbi:hypothetical protein E4T56_gene9700, partial [Termitomyces sp. T112]
VDDPSGQHDPFLDLTRNAQRDGRDRGHGLKVDQAAGVMKGPGQHLCRGQQAFDGGGLRQFLQILAGLRRIMARAGHRAQQGVFRRRHARRATGRDLDRPARGLRHFQKQRPHQHQRFAEMQAEILKHQQRGMGIMQSVDRHTAHRDQNGARRAILGNVVGKDAGQIR